MLKKLCVAFLILSMVLAPIAVTADETFNVTVRLESNEPVSTVAISIEYNTEIMQRTDITAPGEIMRLSTPPPGDANPFNLLFSMEDVQDSTTTHGTLASIQFSGDSRFIPGDITASLVSAYLVQDGRNIPVNLAVIVSGNTIRIISPDTEPTTRTNIINGGAGAYATPLNALAGQTVRLNAGAPPAWHEFAGWTSNEVSIVNAGSPYAARFLMPSGRASVRVVAQWTRTPLPAGFGGRMSAQHVTAVRGAYVDVAISLDDNLGIVATDFTVLFDESVFTRIDAIPGNIMNMYSDLAENITRVNLEVANLPHNTTATGTLFTLRFRVSGTAATGVYPITISMRNTYRLDGTTPVEVAFQIAHGSIIVIAQEDDAEGFLASQIARRIVYAQQLLATTLRTDVPNDLDALYDSPYERGAYHGDFVALENAIAAAKDALYRLGFGDFIPGGSS